jgi:hypothetical protein
MLGGDERFASFPSEQFKLSKFSGLTEYDLRTINDLCDFVM